MKSKNYAYLITAGEIEIKMIRDLLRSADIPSEVHPSAIADALAGQAVHSNLSYEVRVPNDLLARAKEVLGL